MVNCPKTNTNAKKVDTATVKSMMSESLRELRNDDIYYFCADEGCDVVYFNESASHIISIEAIREIVYQKAPDKPQTKICYCFQYTVGDVQQSIVENTQDILLADINEGVQQGQCACDWRNPQGTCCLGNVRTFIKNTKSSNR